MSNCSSHVVDFTTAYTLQQCFVGSILVDDAILEHATKAPEEAPCKTGLGEKYHRDIPGPLRVPLNRHLTAVCDLQVARQRSWSLVRRSCSILEGLRLSGLKCCTQGLP